MKMMFFFWPKTFHLRKKPSISGGRVHIPSVVTAQNSLADHRPATRSPDLQALGATAARLTARFKALDLFERLAAICNEVHGVIVFTTSFGLEDQVIAHAIFAQNLAVKIVTLDTGRLFPETHQLWAETEQRYGRRICAVVPEHGAVEAFVAQHSIDGFRSSVEARRACCGVRKVEPLGRALAGAAAWITGVRAEQSMDRAAMPYAEVDPLHHLLKVNPLLDWTRSRVVDLVRAHRIPSNPLHDRGFLSIGCAPCTRAVKPGESERAGRWWWEQEEKKECGLHSHPAWPGASLAIATDPAHKD
jgi:phosphoadenosine phosphosulfate reductase